MTDRMGDPLKIGGGGSEQADGSGQTRKAHYDGQDDHAEAAQKLVGNGDNQTGLIQSAVQKHAGSGAQIGQTQIDHQQADARHNQNRKQYFIHSIHFLSLT